MTKQELIQQAWNENLTFDKYMDLVEQLVKQEKTTGPNQEEKLINYTKLNYSRAKRWLKTAQLSEELVNLAKTKSLKILAVTEAWCGDTAQNLPLFDVLSKAVNWEYRLCMRDEHTDLMEHFLINGGKSIPVVIIMDEQLNVIAKWGPRPSTAQKMVMDYKHQPEPKQTYDEFSVSLQKWYNTDKTETLQEEISTILNSI